MDSQEQIEYKVVDVKSSIKNRYLNRLYGLVQKPLEGFLGITKLNSTYDFLKKHTSGNFFERAIKAIGISYEIDDEDFAKIPKTGPLVVVSNHPLGGIDGIIMGTVLLKARSDAKVILNGLLAKMPEIKEYSVCVNPFGGKSATSQNVSAMKETIRLLKSGGCVGTFPSGTVSYIHLRDCCISDPEALLSCWADSPAPAHAASHSRNVLRCLPPQNQNAYRRRYLGAQTARVSDRRRTDIVASHKFVCFGRPQ